MKIITRLPFSHEPVAASAPGGGMAPQICVQFYQATETAWRRYANFQVREQAEQCLRLLTEKGLQARMVRYRICPVAQ